MGRGDLSVRVVAAAPLAVLVTAGSAAAAVTWTTVARGSRVGIGPAKGVAYLARTKVAAQALTRQMRPADAKRVAATDFRRFAVAGVVRGFSSCGWSVRVRRVTRAGTAVRITYVAQAPKGGTVICEAGTTAYEAIRVPLNAIAGVRSARAVPIS